MKKKIVSLALVFSMALALGIGGTVAWLTAKTDSVVNTFTVGDINITLKEAVDTDNDNKASFKMVPGAEITKDPKVTVLKDSEACWLFVKIDESSVLDDYISYTVADGWTALTGVDGVYYRSVAAATADMPFDVLKDNKVKVLDGVTKEDMEDLNVAGATQPTLTFTAYAVQSDNLSDQNADNKVNATDAWMLASAN